MPSPYIPPHGGGIEYPSGYMSPYGMVPGHSMETMAGGFYHHSVNGNGMTPSMLQLSSPSVSDGSPGLLVDERKRNKLNYLRAPVACRKRTPAHVYIGHKTTPDH